LTNKKILVISNIIVIVLFLIAFIGSNAVILGFVPVSIWLITMWYIYKRDEPEHLNILPRQGVNRGVDDVVKVVQINQPKRPNKK